MRLKRHVYKTATVSHNIAPSRANVLLASTTQEEESALKSTTVTQILASTGQPATTSLMTTPALVLKNTKGATVRPPTAAYPTRATMEGAA